MAFLVGFKFLDVNMWRYDRLRTSHSKSYIRSNYNGFSEQIFFSKSWRENGVMLMLINIVLIICFVAYAVLLGFSLLRLDVNKPLFVVAALFALCCLVTTFMIYHNYTRLGIGARGNVVSYAERVITSLVFTAFVCGLIYLQYRGVNIIAQGVGIFR